MRLIQGLPNPYFFGASFVCNFVQFSATLCKMLCSETRMDIGDMQPHATLVIDVHNPLEGTTNQ